MGIITKQAISQSWRRREKSVRHAYDPVGNADIVLKMAGLLAYPFVAPSHPLVHSVRNNGFVAANLLWELQQRVLSRICTVFPFHTVRRMPRGTPFSITKIGIND